MTKTIVKYNLSEIMTKAGEYRRAGLDKSAALKAAWMDAKEANRLMIAFPRLNKNDDLSQNDVEILTKANTKKCQIMCTVDLTADEWAEITTSLLEWRGDLWEKIGGVFLDDYTMLDGLTEWSTPWIEVFRNHGITPVVKVTCEGYEPFYVNTEGYDYARYVGRDAVTVYGKQTAA